ncbi:endonuclease Q family protein [Ammoniphilus sp. CFH 90114]|uniref:endonuclease Q family protein n=1 Tax=Ammoniphilus sp. CFH 90114 TaxID=2493665 RepID=UPI00100FD2AB|nr:endonuclease Q family protein [Ammoniphilus sp. CFH 90114]RXT13825.1 TIGR00375 family protein [Ammoniphilus sp. CFH 90114]
MREYFSDLHIHIGRTYKGKAVKITASKTLTFSRILEEAADRKGLDMVGIIDMHSPEVLEEMADLIQAGLVQELPRGGLRYKDTTIILGSEVELRFETRGTAHFLVYFPTVRDMKEFSSWLAKRVKNIQLSTQRAYTTAQELQDRVSLGEGFMIPAHIFTPFKSIYGNCSSSMEELLDTSRIPAVELGLSSDSEMADCLSELANKTFVTNSDAHSLPKIAREYQKMQMQECSFKELFMALLREDGRKVTANYGLHPKLGKYHMTRCARCEELVREHAEGRCPYCGHLQLITGVYNRLIEIADRVTPVHPPHRPAYIHQVPLEFIPGLGPKKMEELLFHFKTEMNILHVAKQEELASVVGEKVANLILKNRSGEMVLEVGGGGRYGKILS